MRSIDFAKELAKSANSLKTVGAVTTLDKDITAICATIDAASDLDKDINVLVVGGMTFPLSDYSLSTAFSSLARPRKVTLAVGYGYKDLRVRDESVYEDFKPYIPLNPMQFAEAQDRVFAVFRKNVTDKVTLEAATEFSTLSEMVKRLDYGEYVTLDEQSPLMPCAVAGNFVLPGMGIPREYAIEMLIRSVIAKVRA